MNLRLDFNMVQDKDPYEEWKKTPGYTGNMEEALDFIAGWQAAKQDSAEQRHLQEPTAWYLRNDIRGIVLFHKDEVESYIADGYELIYALYKE